MKYIAGIFVLWSIIYIFSFVKFNITRKNITAAVGSFILILSVIAAVVAGMIGIIGM